ncbi:MAG: hypothetical protein PHY93_20380, partial [Bacteriovorax sp.]|nr:hypothetical protein [Bacteriovorax sp.]
GPMFEFTPLRKHITELIFTLECLHDGIDPIEINRPQKSIDKKQDYKTDNYLYGHTELSHWS